MTHKRLMLYRYIASIGSVMYAVGLILLPPVPRWLVALYILYWLAHILLWAFLMNLKASDKP